MLRFIAVLIPIVFALLGITGGKWLESFAFALSVAVGLMPEMLPMVITACLARGSLTMSRKQTIIKDINAMQGFGSMDVLCMDKTGTLTNESILLEYYMDVLGNESSEVRGLCAGTFISKRSSKNISPASTTVSDRFSVDTTTW